MINIIFTVVTVIIGIFVALSLIRSSMDKKFIMKAFDAGSVTVTGHKRRGKDMLFSYVVNRRKKPCLSNMKYSDQTTIVDIKELNLGENDYKHFIDGNVQLIKKREEWEGQDYFLGDGGIYLPSQHQGEPGKDLSDAAVILRHIQTTVRHEYSRQRAEPQQAMGQTARAQRLLHRLPRLPSAHRKVFKLRMTFYDKYESALQRLEPFKVDRRLLGKDKQQQALKRQYESTNGTIRKRLFISALLRNITTHANFIKSYSARAIRARTGERAKTGIYSTETNRACKPLKQAPKLIQRQFHNTIQTFPCRRLRARRQNK